MWSLHEATAPLSLKKRSKGPSSGPQLLLDQRQTADPARSIFFSDRRAVINNHPDLNLLFYQFHPSPIYQKRKPFGSKCD